MGHCQLHAVLLQESNCLEDARLIAFRECANPLIRRHTTARILVENHTPRGRLCHFFHYILLVISRQLRARAVFLLLISKAASCPTQRRSELFVGASWLCYNAYASTAVPVSVARAERVCGKENRSRLKHRPRFEFVAFCGMMAPEFENAEKKTHSR